MNSDETDLFNKRDVDTRNGLECYGLLTVYERDKGEDEKKRLVLLFSSIAIRSNLFIFRYL